MKKMLYVLIGLLIVVAVIFIIASISKQNTTGDESGSTVSNLSPEESRSLEEAYLRYAIHPSLLPYAHIEVASLSNIATGTDAFGTYLTLRLLTDQVLKNNGERSEISIDFPYVENDTIEYTWSFMIPTDFISDAPANRWWLIADWHDQPNPALGETWDTYETKSTPIIFGYGNIDGSDLFTLSTGSWRTEQGIEPRGAASVTRGVWHSVRMVVHWSQQETGRVTVYLDNAKEPTFDVRGQNMVNSYQHYMKIGQYRHQDINTENAIFIKDVSITRK